MLVCVALERKIRYHNGFYKSFLQLGGGGGTYYECVFFYAKSGTTKKCRRMLNQESYYRPFE